MLRAAITFLVVVGMPMVASASGGGHGDLHFSDIYNGEHKFEFWATVLNFGLLVFVLRKMARRPLSDFLKGRRAELEEGMREAAEMKAKAEARYKEYSDRMEQLDDELKKMKADIEEAAVEEKRTTLADAQENADRLEQETKALIELTAQQLTLAVKREVVDAAVEAAEQVLVQSLGQSDQTKLAQDYVKHVAASKPEGRA